MRQVLMLERTHLEWAQELAVQLMQPLLVQELFLVQ